MNSEERQQAGRLERLAKELRRPSVVALGGLAIAMALLIIAGLRETEWVLPIVSTAVAAVTGFVFARGDSRRRRDRADRRQVYIAHRAADHEPARKLARAVAEAGYHPWMFENELAAGELWADQIDTALRESGAVLVVVPPEMHDTPSLEAEIFAANRNVFAPNPKANPILPVIVEAGVNWTDVPSVLSRVQAITLGAPNWHAELKDFLDTAFVGDGPHSAVGKVAPSR